MNSNKNFHLKQTWEQKYRVSTGKYQWIETAEETFSKLQPYLPKNKQAKILELGCGTSSLWEIFKQNGYNEITCLDFSKRLIKGYGSKNDSPLFICADFTEPFKFEPETEYDLIIDKGSIDCVFCEEDWLKKILTCMMNCFNRLKNGGKLISVSLGQPKNRKYWFRNKLAPFQLEIIKQTNNLKEAMRKNVKGYQTSKEENSEDYFIYVCTKNSQDVQNFGDQNQNNMAGIDLNQEANDLSEEGSDQQKEDDQNQDEGQKGEENNSQNQGQNPNPNQDQNQNDHDNEDQPDQNQNEQEDYGNQFEGEEN